MANTYLSRTPSSAGSATKWTLSMWVKRGKLGVQTPIISTVASSPSNTYEEMYFNTSDKFQFSTVYNNSQKAIRTTRVFRDVNAWYHIQFVYDTTNSTVTDHAILYINGVRETSFEDTTLLASGANDWESSWNKASNPMRIGYQSTNTASYFDGSMSHIHFANNQAYAPTIFGSVDSTTGEWKINTSPSVTYGTNGFFILKDGNSVTDQSGNSNNFTVGGGTLTKTEDCPSNVFATVSNLDNYYPASSFANGNNQLTTNSSNYTFNNATLGYSSGKYYWETKITHTSNYDHIGITEKGSTGSTNYMYDCPNSYVLKSNNGVLKENTGSGQGTVSGFSGVSFGVGNIISIAHDADNNKIYFAKDGVWMNSANPNTPTGGITTTAASATNTGVWLPAFGDENNGTYTVWQVNFGNGYFGTTAVSSAGTNASGNGIFEYDVPTGYTALSTKGLNL